MSVNNISALKKASTHELYRLTKSAVRTEQNAGLKQTGKLEALLNELDSRGRKEVYSDALRDAELEILEIENASSGFRAIDLKSAGSFSVYELAELLMNSLSTGIKKNQDIELADNKELLKTFGISESSYICTVAGESMIDASIFDGDTLIVKRNEVAVDNDIIVAKVNDDMFVKRLKMIDGKQFFLSENKNFKPVEINNSMDVEFIGVVSSVIHKLKK